MLEPAALRQLLHQSLEQTLHKLESQAGDAVSRRKLQLLETLLTRAGGEREPVANLLYRRVHTLLASFEQDLQRAQENLPSSLPAAGQSPFSGLLNELRGNNNNDDQPLSELDRKMQEQKARLVGSSNATREAPKATNEPTGLRAAKQLKQLQGRRANHRKVQFALDNRPENPGPLNPHKLAVQILREIQTQSPAYLERLVSYIDALALLDEQAVLTAKKAASKAVKKAASAKAKR